MSITLWLGMMLLLTLVAALFVVFPVRFGSQTPIVLARHNDRVAVFESRRTELQAEHEQGQISTEELNSLLGELDRQLLSETADTEQAIELKGRLSVRWAVATLAVMLALSALVYQATGARAALNLYQLAEQRHTSDAALAEFVTALADHLARQRRPDVEDLYALAMAYDELGLPEQAISTLEQVEALYRNFAEYDPQDLSVVLSNRAQIRFMMTPGALAAATEADFLEALRLDPLNSQALATLGMAYLQQGRPEQAVELWQRFLQVVPAGSMATAVRGALEHAESLLAGGTGDVGVQVVVSALSEDIPIDADIYIVARDPDTGTLVAIERYPANELPPALRLTEQHRLAETGPSLANLPTVEVIAFAVPVGQPLSAATHRSGVVQALTQGPNAQAALTLSPL